MPGWGEVACSLASLALAGHLLPILVSSCVYARRRGSVESMSNASNGRCFTWDLAPPSTAGPDLVPTGGRDGCRFSLKFSNWLVIWRLFQAPSRQWAECREEFPLWISLGLNVRVGAVEAEHQVHAQLGVGRVAGAGGVGLGVGVLPHGGRSS